MLLGSPFPQWLFLRETNLQSTVGEGTYYGMSDKGWTDQELLKHWLKDHFLQYAVPNRPLLILLYRHRSHYEPASIQLARTEGVIIFCLPPYCVWTLKTSLVSHLSWISAVWWLASLTSLSCLRIAWLQALTPANIVAVVRSCGIYPFNCNAISFPDDGDSGSSGIIPRNPSSHNATDGDHSVVASTVNSSTSIYIYRMGIISTMTKTMFHGLNLIIQKQHHPI